MSAGADVVIHSVHKTLPALTQTAILHIQGRLADRERIRHFLSVYQSSSPSYVLMASIDACVDLLERKGTELFRKHVKGLSAFRESCRDLKTLYLAGDDMAAGYLAETAGREPEGNGQAAGACDFDRSKLLISARRTGLSGSRLSKLFLERYHLQMEMSGPDYVVGIASIADTEEGFSRLSRALHELARGYAGCREKTGRFPGAAATPRLPLVPAVSASAEREKELCSFSAAAGGIAAAYVYLYPPGIPLLVPGERITEEAVCRIGEWLEAGFAVHGLREGRELPIVRER